MLMKYMYLMPIFAIIVAVLYSSCSPKKYLPNQYKKKQLIFGSGGGFTGAVTTYVLQENGEIYKFLTDTTYEAVTILPKDTTKNYFSTLDTLHLDSLDFNHPGNMYFFIEKKDGFKDEESARVTWGDGKHNPPTGIKELHTSLTQVIRDLKQRPRPQGPAK